MTNKNRHTRRKYAQSLAKKGFKIFRIKPNKKTPVATGWQKEAASDATPWSNGQDYNIGIACEDSFGIIDIDMKNDVDGEANWKALCDEHDIADSPFQSKTPAKGRHVIYKMPKGVSLSNSTSKIAEGVDVRGLGGYVVAPGSEIDGIMYDVLAKGADIIEMPKALIDLCQKSRVRDEDYSVPVGELDTPDNVARAEAYLKVAREAVEGAGGDGTAFAVSARVREMGISEATFYNWKKKYGGLGVSGLRRLKNLEEENSQLKKLVADLSLDKQILQDVLKKKFRDRPENVGWSIISGWSTTSPLSVAVSSYYCIRVFFIIRPRGVAMNCFGCA